MDSSFSGCCDENIHVMFHVALSFVDVSVLSLIVVNKVSIILEPSLKTVRIETAFLIDGRIFLNNHFDDSSILMDKPG